LQKKLLNSLVKSVYDFSIQLLKDVFRTVLILFRIMIPVTIVVKLLQMAGFITVIGHALFPIMKYVGLPGEMGLVWASGMITNLFGGVIAFIGISNGMGLTINQVTVISIMMLVAHTFPIELQIARKTGVRLLTMFLIRFGFGFLFGFIIFHLYDTFGWGTQTAQIVWKPSALPDNSLSSWAIGELKNYGVIVCFIFSLMLMLRILKLIGVLDIITRLLNPFLKIMGIGKEVTTIALVGLTLGVVYGGALIIDEVKTNSAIRKNDILFAMVLMGLCHSVIEDTILMVSLGASFVGIFIIRFILSMIIVYILVKITGLLSEKMMYRLFLRREKKII
jgi:hypothetical protein